MDNKTKKSTGNQISSKDNVILHLSDLHFGYDENQQKKADREIVLKELIDILSQQESDWKPTIVCISGDIAWSAKKSDYKAAGKWFKKLFKTLDITNENVVICPGNHDVNRNEASYIPRPKDPKEADETLKVPIAGFFDKPFSEYMKLYKQIGVPPLIFLHFTQINDWSLNCYRSESLCLFYLLFPLLNYEEPGVQLTPAAVIRGTVQ